MEYINPYVTHLDQKSFCRYTIRSLIHIFFHHLSAINRLTLQTLLCLTKKPPKPQKQLQCILWSQIQLEMSPQHSAEQVNPDWHYQCNIQVSATYRTRSHLHVGFWYEALIPTVISCLPPAISYVLVNTHTQTQTHIRTQTHTYTYAHAHTLTHMHAHAQTDARVRAHTHTSICVLRITTSVTYLSLSLSPSSFSLCLPIWSNLSTSTISIYFICTKCINVSICT